MLLVAIGFCVATLGTLIGVGGGFILVPLLLYLYPEAPHVWVAGVSLWLVTFNAGSGSVAYFFQGKVHLRAGILFILAGVPGSILGIFIEHHVTRAYFELIFGGVMMVYAIYLFRKKPNLRVKSDFNAVTPLTPDQYFKGAWISFFVGFFASFLGIGGGVIHVPLLAHVLDFPVHMAAGTSHFILACSAVIATLTHVYEGDLKLTDPVLWQLGAAAVVGAQLGAYLSHKVSGPAILKILSVALFLVGVRLILINLHAFA
jgi:uncharacterized membrane protein YfcA